MNYPPSQTCQSEPVEDSRAEALPTMLRQAQYAPHFNRLSC